MLPISRQNASTAGKSLVRISRRRLTTETPLPPPPPAPKKRRRAFRNVVLATATLSTSFYIGSTFLSFNNQWYHDFFTERVPLGRAFLEFGQVRHWDTLTTQKVLDSAKNVPGNLQRFFTSTSDPQPTRLPTGHAETATKREPSTHSPSVRDSLHKSADRIKGVASTLKTNVERSEHELSDKGKKAVAIARHQSVQFSEGVEELIRKAEAALASTSAFLSSEEPNPKLQEESGPLPTSPQTQPLPVPGIPTPSSEPSTTTPPRSKVSAETPVYSLPLPIGFEPPPGYSAPKAPKRDRLVPLPKVKARPPPLPKITPAMAEFDVSDPVIVHLASTIDALASNIKLASSPSAMARGALESAKSDLAELAANLRRIREEGQAVLEQKLDEQTKEFTLRLLELEIEARDKLDAVNNENQEYSNEEKVELRREFRRKVDEELHRQTEQMNEQLKERVTPMGIDMQQRWISDLKDRMEQERNKRLAKLDELSADVKRLERVVLDNSTHLEESNRINDLWTAIRSLNTAIEASTRKPFRKELRALQAVADAEDDPAISAAIENVEKSDLPDIGVEPLGDLVSWFSTSVAPQVSNVALVPDHDAGVLSHLASYLLSSLRFQRHGLVPGSDVLSVLARAEYYLNGGDLDSAARELNQVKGTAKVLLSDWLDAARRRLEVQRMLEAIETHATLATQLVATPP